MTAAERFEALSDTIDRVIDRLGVLENALHSDDDTGADLVLHSSTRKGLLLVLGDAVEELSELTAAMGLAAKGEAS